MSVQSINESIDQKIIETNDRTNRSIEIRQNLKDKDLQEKIERFDKTCLNAEEREQIEALNEAEQNQLKESSKYAVKSAYNGVKFATSGIIGKSLGAFGATDNAQRYADSEDKLSEISNTRDEIRTKAQSRYEKATGLTVDFKNETKTAEEVYDNGR